MEINNYYEYQCGFTYLFQLKQINIAKSPIYNKGRSVSNSVSFACFLISLSNKVFAYWCLEFKKKVSLMKVSRVDTFLIFINGLHFVFISGRVIGILFSFDVCLANELFLSNSLASYCGK